MKYTLIQKINNYIYYNFTMKNLCKNFGCCGNNVFIGANCIIEGEKNIHIKNNVSVGERCVLLTTEANIYIGNYVMFAPEVAIVTGNHRIDFIGEYMMQVKEKKGKNDEDVTINDDVWVGLRAIILKGVTIGKGAVIAAGAVVTCNVPEYTIYYSKDKMQKRFSDKEIAEHEKAIKYKYRIKQ